ncbi:MAG TPA: MATE family efflux transporter, partial [Candidatus Fimicola cottocaccae]|nr:MATE family efflux transporter [Candidatus Fimicola cottocaccae]
MTDYEKINQKGYLQKMIWPIFIELILQMLVGNVDQIMVGKYSANSVGAIANANQIMNLLIIIFSVICTATTIIISLYLGAGDKKKVEQTYTLSIFVNFIFSLIISFVFLVFGRQILEWLKVPYDIIGETESYIKIIGSFIFLQSIYLTFGAILRSNTFMKYSMIVSFIVNAINIGGNFILINGFGNIPAMGVAGAAVSSNISRFIGVIVIYIIFRKKTGAKLRLSHIYPFPFGEFKKLMGIGIPSGGESLSYNLSQIAIQRMINTFGSAIISTKAYASIFANFSYVYGAAVSQAGQIMVGYLIGAGDVENTEKRVWKTLRIAMITALVISVTIFFVSDYCFGFFTDNREVIELGKKIMFIDIFLELGRSCNMIFVRALSAAGDIKFPITLGIINVWLVAVLGGFILSEVFGLGLVGIWIAMTADECIRGIVFIFRWKSGVWKNKK